MHSRTLLSFFQPAAFYSRSLIIKENQPLPDEVIDKWFDYMAKTDSGTIVGSVDFPAFNQQLLTPSRRGLLLQTSKMIGRILFLATRRRILIGTLSYVELSYVVP
jgi:hypothetical protein